MGDTFWSGVLGSGFVSALALLWLKGYFEPYLRKKAENLATHEDIATLINQVRETEQVKADITGRMWDRQARWTAMKDHYVALIEQLTKLIDFLNEYFRVSGTLKEGGDVSPLFTQLAAMGEHGSEMARQLNVSRLFMPEQVLAEYLATTQKWGDLLKLLNENPLGTDSIRLLRAYREQMLVFIKAARQDLGT